MAYDPDPRASFNRAAGHYDSIRPSYPPALFDQLSAMLPDDPHLLEVGPGTGQATADLLARGARVDAVELGDELAATLRHNLPTDRLQITVGDFEQLPEQGSYDGLFSATAYHWISDRAQLDRPAALLRPGGVLAIMHTVQVDDPADRGFFAAAQPIYQRYGQGHTGPPAPVRERADSTLRPRLESDPRFDRVQLLRQDWDQRYTAEQYRRLMLSYSGTQLMAEPDRELLLDEIQTLVIDQFDGWVLRPLVITLVTARLAPLGQG